MIPPDALYARVKRLRLLWGVMLVSVAVFGTTVWLFVRRGRLDIGRPLDTGMLTTLGMVIAVALLLAPLVRRQIERVPRGAAVDEVMRRWELGWIVGQAIKEGVGIAGLVIALLIGSSSWALGFAVASLASMLMTPPWEHQLHAHVRRHTGSDATAL